MEQFELIDPTTTTILLRNKPIPFSHQPKKFAALGIQWRDYENPRNLAAFEDILRFWNETNPTLIAATEYDIRKHIPQHLNKLMVLNQFHFTSAYEQSILPSKQELWQLVAKVLVSKDTTQWKPTQAANNHWRNWESGNL
nr:hypothetical protein [Chitinophaga skermanii]